MGNGDYYIETDEVHALDIGYSSYYDKIEEGTGSLSGSVNKIVCLDTFQGAAAQSVKQYFQEVHYPLIDALYKLAEQLLTDFDKEYAPGFFNAPVNAGIGACLPEQELRDVEKRLSSLIAGDMEEADKYAKAAINCLPAGVSFSMPSPAVAKTLMEGEINHIKKTREGVRALEDQGAALFVSKDSAFADLAKALGAAIATCAKGSIPITSYTAGGFNAVVASTGLRSAYLKCVNDQEMNHDKVLKARTECFDREAIRIKEAEEKALQQKKTMCWVGTVFAVAAFVATAAALVATAGAATPLIFALKATAGGIGLWKSGQDLIARTEQSLKVELEIDPLADKEDTKSEVADASKKTGKYIAKGFEAKHDRGDSSKLMADGIGLRDSFIKEGIGYTFDALGDASGNDLVEAYIDATGEIVEEGWSQMSDRALDPTTTFDGMGAIGTLGKAGEIMADYCVKEADEELEDLQRRSEMLEEMRESAESGSRRPLSSIW